VSINIFEVVGQLGLPLPKGILQLGASYGQEIDAFVAYGVKSGIFIEPLAAPFQALAEKCKKVPGFVAIQTLCSDVTGKTYTFHVASNVGMSSSILTPGTHLQQFDYVKFNETIEVISNRLDDVIDFADANGYQHVTSGLDTLYMDTQGAELMILQGGEKVLTRINYIFTEITRNNLYIGAPSLAEIISFLDARGFTLNNAYFTSDHWGDALFIKKTVLGISA
jgi:FkbM family methyltransferase